MSAELKLTIFAFYFTSLYSVVQAVRQYSRRLHLIALCVIEAGNEILLANITEDFVVIKVCSVENTVGNIFKLFIGRINFGASTHLLGSVLLHHILHKVSFIAHLATLCRGV